MTKPKTKTTIILDRSGSMHSIRQQAVTSYNEQVQQMKENSKDQDIFCSLITFNGNVFEHHWEQRAEILEEADESSYVPNGGTAFYDAIGYAINKLKETDDEETAHLIIVISDGIDQGSRIFSPNQVRELVEAQQKTNRWTFSFLGCDATFLKQLAKETGIPLANMAVWSNANEKSAAFGFTEARNCNHRYYESRTKGLLSTANLYSNDSAVCANFTPEPGDSVDVSSGTSLADMLKGSNISAEWPTLNNPYVPAQEVQKANSLRMEVPKRSLSANVFGNGRAVS